MTGASPRWRKVPWTVPGFTLDGYAEQLARMHRRASARVGHSFRMPGDS
jgi:hypothetical protein